jgi:hypothetical protein
MTPPTLGELRLQRLLQVLALLDLLALLAVVMPRESMAQVHAWLGLGTLITEPVTIYLARTVSLLYAFQGATFWHLSGDVRKYRALIAFWGRLTLVGAGVFLVIDIMAGLPWWWAVGELLCLVAIGGSLVWAERRLEHESPSSPRRRAREVSVDDPAEVGS